jgi:hypothetical protein
MVAGLIATAITEYFRGPDNVPCPLTREKVFRFDLWSPTLHISDRDDEGGEANKNDEAEAEPWGEMIRACPTTLEGELEHYLDS